MHDQRGLTRTFEGGIVPILWLSRTHVAHNSFRISLRAVTAFVVLLTTLVLTHTGEQNTFPAGFSEVKIADKLNSPTAMAVAPDGRIFVTQQGGAIRIIKNDVLLPTPFFTVTTGAYDEQGLSGIAFDPDFGSNGFVYVSYSPANGNNRTHQRISRITIQGDAGSDETTLFEMPQSNLPYHLAGALLFGNDGSLYVSTGEGVGTDAQSDTNFAGKVLRLNKDGSVPSDNPYCTNTALKHCAIWAKGFRNPFVMSLQLGTGRIYANDVGGSAWEEVNEINAGKNYGYPLSEGSVVRTGQTAPVYAYAHSEGCAVVGGAFYNAAQFPAAYQGKYFFADYCSGWIRYLNPSSPQDAAVFGTATGIGIVGLQVGQNGSLYYLARGSTALDGGSGAGFDTGSVYRLSYTGSQAPYFISQPQNQTVAVGHTASFKVEVGGGQPLYYQWQKNEANIAGAQSLSFTTSNLSLTDSGAQYRVVVTNTSGRITSTVATLTVLNNQPPAVAIIQPSPGSSYTNGQVLAFAGTGSDPENMLQTSAFTWKIELHHDGHVHPFMQPTNGIASGTIALPDVPHATSGVFYRLFLTVSDGQLAATTTRDIYPSTKKVIVNWGGDYVTSDTALQRFIAIAPNVDLDGNGEADDTRAYIPFSDAQPISPNPSGGNAYGGTYAQGNSWRFYGGLLLQHYNRGFEAKWAEIWNRPNGLDRIYQSADPLSDSWMALYWQKQDFLEGGDANPVSFDANSSLEVLNYAGADGNASDNAGRLRFIVKNDTQFYISKDFADNTTSTFTLTNPSAKQWALYNPSPPFGIQFDVSTANFAPRIFDNITAAGVYHATDNSHMDGRRAGFNFERFRVVATIGSLAPITPTPNVKPSVYLSTVINP